MKHHGLSPTSSSPSEEFMAVSYDKTIETFVPFWPPNGDKR